MNLRRFNDILPTYIFHAKIQLFLADKCGQDPDPHGFGFLDPDPH
jgi:hypothetical protein